jgi:hypothetical protein
VATILGISSTFLVDLVTAVVKIPQGVVVGFRIFAWAFIYFSQKF